MPLETMQYPEEVGQAFYDSLMSGTYAPGQASLANVAPFWNQYLTDLGLFTDIDESNTDMGQGGFGSFMSAYGQYLPQDYDTYASNLERQRRLLDVGKTELASNLMLDKANLLSGMGKSGFAGMGAGISGMNDISDQYRAKASALDIESQESMEDLYTSIGNDIMASVSEQSQNFLNANWADLQETPTILQEMGFANLAEFCGVYPNDPWCG